MVHYSGLYELSGNKIGKSTLMGIQLKEAAMAKAEYAPQTEGPHRGGDLSKLAFILELRLIQCVPAVVVISAVAVGMLLLRLALSSVIDIKGDEHFVLYGVQKIMRGLYLYSNPFLPPFDVEPYSPLYYYLAAFLARALGLSYLDAPNILVSSRLLSLTFFLTALGFVSLILRERLQVSRPLCLTACGFLLVVTAPWSVTTRPDSLLSLSLITMTYFAMKCFEEGSAHYKYLVLAILFGIVATFAKQNGLMGPISLALFSLMHRRWRSLALVVAATTVFVGGAFLLGPALFGSGLTANVITGINNGLLPSLSWEMLYSPFFSRYAFLIALVVDVVIRSLKKPPSLPIQFLIFNAVLIFGAASIYGLKWGAASNYYNDFLILAVIIIVLDLSNHLKARSVELGNARALVIAVYVLCLISAKTMDSYLDRWSSSPREAFEARAPVVEFLRAELNRAPDSYFLSLDPGINALLPDQCLVPQDGNAYQWYTRGIFNYSPLEALMREGRVRFVVFKRNNVPESFLGIRFQNFKHVRDISEWSIFGRAS